MASYLLHISLDAPVNEEIVSLNTMTISAGAPGKFGGATFDTLDFSLPSYNEAVSGKSAPKEEAAAPLFTNPFGGGSSEEDTSAADQAKEDKRTAAEQAKADREAARAEKEAEKARKAEEKAAAEAKKAEEKAAAEQAKVEKEARRKEQLEKQRLAVERQKEAKSEVKTEVEKVSVKALALCTCEASCEEETHTSILYIL